MRKEELDYLDIRYAVCKTLIKILNADLKKSMNLTDLARAIGISKGAFSFRFAIKILLENDLMLMEKGKYGYELTINKIALKDYLDETNEINWLVEEYFGRHHKFLW